MAHMVPAAIQRKTAVGPGEVDLLSILDGFGEYVRRTPSVTITVNARKLSESMGIALENNKIIGDALAMMADRGILEVMKNADGSPHELSGAGIVYSYERVQTMRGADTFPVSKIHLPTDPLWDQTESMLDMMSSIKHAGLHYPIEVRPSKQDKEKYEVVEGCTRFRACMALGTITRVRAIILDISDRQAVFKALEVNLARGTKNPVDEARAFSRVIEQGWATQKELALKIGHSPKYVTERLQLLDLPAEVQQQIKDQTITQERALYDYRHPGEIYQTPAEIANSPLEMPIHADGSLHCKYPAKTFVVGQREFRVDWDAKEIWEKAPKRFF